MPTFSEYLNNNPMDWRRKLMEKDMRPKIVQQLKIHPMIAEYAHFINEDNAEWVANVVKNELAPRYSQVYGVPLKELQTAIADTKNTDPKTVDTLQTFVSDFLNRDIMNSAFAGIMDWVRGMNGGVKLSRNPRAGERPNKAFTLDEATQAQEAWHEAQTKKAGGVIEEDPGLEVVMKFPDGFYWVDLKCNKAEGDNACSKESKSMGHCGTCTQADTILSLRNEKVPYVTLAVSRGENSIYSIYNQCKGRKNEKPVAKYHPYIVDFFIKYKVERYESAYLPAKDFHPSDLSQSLFLKLINADPDIMNFPDVPIQAYAHGLIPLEQAMKSLHIRNFTIDEAGVKITIPKGRMSVINDLFIFPDFNPAVLSGRLTPPVIMSKIDDLMFMFKTGSEPHNTFTAPMENLFRWYLVEKGYPVNRKGQFAMDKINSLYSAGDSFLGGMFKNIVETVLKGNSARIYPRPPVTDDAGVVVERDYDSTPIDITHLLSQSPDGVVLSLTVPEYLKVVESGGGNFDIKDGADYISNCNKREDRNDSLIESDQATILASAMENVKTSLEKYLGGSGSEEQAGFAFDDEFTPDNSAKVDNILSGAVNA